MNKLLEKSKNFAAKPRKAELTTVDDSEVGAPHWHQNNLKFD
jgi:hypothetical protein